jgi:hypothetical protein
MKRIYTTFGDNKEISVTGYVAIIVAGSEKVLNPSVKRVRMYSTDILVDCHIYHLAYGGSIFSCEGQKKMACEQQGNMQM